MRWVHIAFLGGNALFLLPLPVLLFMLYRTRATLATSLAMRRLALGTALIYGLLFAIPGIHGAYWRVASDWRNLRSWGGNNTAENIFNWLSAPGTQEQILSLLGPFSQLGLVLVLLALWRQPGSTEASPSRWPVSLTKVAAAATIMGGIAIALNTIEQVYAVMAFNKQPVSDGWFFIPTRGQFALHNLLSGVPEVCRTMVALIEYRSRSRLSGDAQVSANEFPLTLDG